MPSSVKIAIVAALEREVEPLVRDWRVSKRTHTGHEFKVYESETAVLICGGIGPQAARRATEAIIAIYAPEMIYSVGFAGALDPEMKVGDILRPSRVINAADGSATNTGAGEHTLISFASVASPEQKAKLRNSFSAQAVDMEAAAVAQAAAVRGIKFAAVKVISDESNFMLPPMERFVTPDGQFRTAQFTLFAMIRPWLWPTLARLARNSSKAARALCHASQQIVADEKVTHQVSIETSPDEVLPRR